MKLIRRIAAAVATVLVLSSCGLLQGGTTTTTTANAGTTGSDTGNALAAIFNIFKTTGNIDLSNITNIINLGKILTGAKSLANSTATYTQEFADGLIQGSSQLVNKENVNSVIEKLKSLAAVNTTAISNAATKAYAGTAPKLSSSTAGVGQTESILKDIFGEIK